MGAATDERDSLEGHIAKFGIVKLLGPIADMEDLTCAGGGISEGMDGVGVAKDALQRLVRIGGRARVAEVGLEISLGTVEAQIDLGRARSQVGRKVEGEPLPFADDEDAGVRVAGAGGGRAVRPG